MIEAARRLYSRQEKIAEDPSSKDGAGASRASSVRADVELSVVIPVYNEVGNVRQLALEVIRTLPETLRYEIIFVDDGSSDGTAEEIKRAFCCFRIAGQRSVLHTAVGDRSALRIGNTGCWRPG